MNAGRILVTGVCGLIGTAVAASLRACGYEVLNFDVRAPLDLNRGDVRDPLEVARAVAGCSGIVHLAAVSRVVWGEQDPALCASTNIQGTKVVLDAALSADRRPWVIFASSREVYGEAESLPVTEDADLRPVNVYGRTKVVAEGLVGEAQRAGLRAMVLRLSNVYGSAADHEDWVVPAFVRAAVRGGTLRVDGARSTFDFTHVDDVARGVVRVAALLDDGSPPAPIHLVSGMPTTLGELAEMVVALAGTHARLEEQPPRSFDVGRFVGDASRARQVLGWEPRIPLRHGLARLIHDFRAAAGNPLEAR